MASPSHSPSISTTTSSAGATIADHDVAATIGTLKAAMRSNDPDELHRAIERVQHADSADPQAFANLTRWQAEAASQLQRLEREWRARHRRLLDDSMRHLQRASRRAEDIGLPDPRLREAIEEAEALASQKFLQTQPPEHAAHAHALRQAQEQLRRLEWQQEQPELLRGLQEAAVAALHNNYAAAGDADGDIRRSKIRWVLKQQVAAANAAKDSAPPELLETEVYEELVSCLRRAAELLTALEAFWTAELAARRELRPRWVPDEEGGACRGCGWLLGWHRLVRRHHCRQCGEVFCWACSPYTKPLKALGYAREQRVCTACAQTLCAAAPRPPIPDCLVPSDNAFRLPVPRHLPAWAAPEAEAGPEDRPPPQNPDWVPSVASPGRW